MAICFQQTCVEEDSVILFSTSNSPDESTSPSSSFYHSPPPLTHHSKTSYKLIVKNLSYTIHPNRSIPFSFCHLNQKPEPINILKSVSFVARSDEILAIFGPSGTDKSSLLQIISGRIKDKEFDPLSISINDHQTTSPAQLRKICGFVAQDNLLPLLTIKETLMYSAYFKLKEMSAKEKQERVDSLMQELGLLHVANSFVGDEENRGVSSGEKKRVPIGVDMIHDPPILLLDEPTSALIAPRRFK